MSKQLYFEDLEGLFWDPFGGPGIHRETFRGAFWDPFVGLSFHSETSWDTSGIQNWILSILCGF